jgi:hypothetical protein
MSSLVNRDVEPVSFKMLLYDQSTFDYLFADRKFDWSFTFDELFKGFPFKSENERRYCARVFRTEVKAGRLRALGFIISCCKYRSSPSEYVKRSLEHKCVPLAFFGDLPKDLVDMNRKLAKEGRTLILQDAPFSAVNLD